MAYPNDLQRRLGLLEDVQFPATQPAAPAATPVRAPASPPPESSGDRVEGKRCTASELPEWKSASAREKQALMRQCASAVAQ